MQSVKEKILNRFQITVKSFDIQKIRKRYLKSRKNSFSKTGSVERREVAIGGLVSLLISKGQTKNTDILTRVPEPRGVDAHTGSIAFSSENKVFIIHNDKVTELNDLWFSYIHTVCFNPDKKSKLLVSSSGFEAIFEYDFLSGKKEYEWFAWEHGFNKSVDSVHQKEVFLTRNKLDYDLFKKQGKECIYINDPANQVLPTAKRAAFINSVIYNPNQKNEIIATFFHEGAVYTINRNTGKVKRILLNLTNPHGGRAFEDRFLATSTADGFLAVGDIDKIVKYDFSKLPGKPSFLSDFEWLQNSIVVNNNIVTIDSNRNSFVIFNPEKKLIDIIPFNPDWAIQDFIVSTPKSSHLSFIRELGSH